MRYVFSILFSNLFPNCMRQGCAFFNCWSLIIRLLSYTVSRIFNIFDWNAMQFLVFSIFWSENPCNFSHFQYFGVKCHAVSHIFNIFEWNAMRFLMLSIFWSEIPCGFSCFHYIDYKLLLSIVVSKDSKKGPNMFTERLFVNTLQKIFSHQKPLFACFQSLNNHLS